MKPCTSPYKHFFYNQNRARKKSWEKYKKALQWYTELLKREKKEGLTKWIEKTKVKSVMRLKKYGITTDMVKKHLESHGLTNLLS